MNGVHQNQKNILNRVRRINGQVGGIEKMIVDDRYCIDIITQTNAIKKAISALEDEMLRSHLNHCLIDNKKKSIKVLSDEIMEVYTLKTK